MVGECKGPRHERWCEHRRWCNRRCRCERWQDCVSALGTRDGADARNYAGIRDGGRVQGP